MTLRNKATSIRLADFSSAPMRAFHMSWFAFFICFFGWFGLAPLMPDHPPGAASDQSADRQSDHRFGRDYCDCPRAHRVCVRPYRASARLHLAARTWLAASDGSGAGARLPDISFVPPGNWSDRRVVRDHAVSHVGDVRAEHCGHCERSVRGLGKSGRRSDADGHAALVRRLCQPRRRQMVGLANGDVRAGSRSCCSPGSLTTS